MLTLVTREQAGLVAAHPDAPPMVIRSVVGLALHHSAGPSDFSGSQADPNAYMQNLQRYSMQEKGLSDIAYNYVIIPTGVVMEGRGLRFRCAANGTTDGNAKYPSVMFPGDYRTGKDSLTSAQITAFRDLRQFILGVNSKATDLKPHSFFKPTECPGDNIVAAIPSLGKTTPDGGRPLRRPVLRRGSRGEPVRCLQESINNWGGAKLLVDGIFGPVTETAVKRFQKARKLVVDGVVGPQTWSALERYAGCADD